MIWNTTALGLSVHDDWNKTVVRQNIHLIIIQLSVHLT